MSDDAVSVSELADWIDLTPRRVQQLVKDGIVVKTGRGRYDLRKSVQGYIRFLSDQVDRTGSGSDLAKERLLRARADRRKSELALDAELGRLIAVEHHERMVGEAFEVVRARLRNLPGKLAPRMVGLEEARDAQHILISEIDEALRALVRAGDEVGDDELPAGVPGYRKLVSGGVRTIGQLRALGDYTSISGIGKATAAKIADWLVSQ